MARRRHRRPLRPARTVGGAASRFAPGARGRRNGPNSPMELPSPAGASLSDDALATQLLWDACEAGLTAARGGSLARQAGAREDVATRAWCRALLIDPELDDEALTRCAPAAVARRGRGAGARARLTLVGGAGRPETSRAARRARCPGDHEVHRLARDLWRYRRDWASLTEAERFERKRELVRAARVRSPVADAFVSAQRTPQSM